MNVEMYKVESKESFVTLRLVQMGQREDHQRPGA